MIFFVNDTGFINGGASKVCIESILGLSDMDLELNFVYSKGPLDVRVENANIKVIKISSSKFFSTSNFLFFSKLDSSKNLFVVHSWNKNISLSIFSALKKSKIILFNHDYSAFCPNGGYFNFKTNRDCNYNPMGFNCFTSNCDKRNYFFKILRIMKHAFQNKIVNKIKNNIIYINVSKYSHDIIRKFDATKNFILLDNSPKIIPVNFLHKPKHPIHHLAYIGRLSEEKGILDLIKIVKKNKYKLIIFGDGSQVIKKLLTQDADKFDFRGWKSHEEIIKELSLVNLIVFPSKVRETFGLVPLEFLHLGIPILAPDQSPLFYSKYRSKLNFFKRGCVDSLADKIKYLTIKKNISSLKSKNYIKSSNSSFNKYLKKLSKIIYENHNT
jgi:glycosyltransferase involved in cell wall biosynthesis